jgi:hypothetical protein
MRYSALTGQNMEMSERGFRIVGRRSEITAAMYRRSCCTAGSVSIRFQSLVGRHLDEQRVRCRQVPITPGGGVGSAASFEGNAKRKGLELGNDYHESEPGKNFARYPRAFAETPSAFYTPTPQELFEKGEILA